MDLNKLTEILQVMHADAEVSTWLTSNCHITESYLVMGTIAESNLAIVEGRSLVMRSKRYRMKA